jgi:hypothetical protein
VAVSKAECHRAWRERHKGEPWGIKALMAELAALLARVAELEAVVAHQAPSLNCRRQRAVCGLIGRTAEGTR